MQVTAVDSLLCCHLQIVAIDRVLCYLQIVAVDRVLCCCLQIVAGDRLLCCLSADCSRRQTALLFICRL